MADVLMRRKDCDRDTRQVHAQRDNHVKTQEKMAICKSSIEALEETNL